MLFFARAAFFRVVSFRVAALPKSVVGKPYHILVVGKPYQILAEHSLPSQLEAVALACPLPSPVPAPSHECFRPK